MKTEIDRICGIMYTLLEHQPVIDVPYEKINDIAVALVKDGYGKTSEYEAEIERLHQEVRDTDKMARNTIEQYRAENEELENALKQSEDNYSRAFERLKAQQREIERLRTTLGQCNAELNSALESLKSQCREIGALKAGVKQAQIDVLNKVKERAVGLPAIETYHICNLIDELIKEVQNGEDKG